MSGYPDEAPILGDVDQDGVLDVVIGSNAGHLWAFRGFSFLFSFFFLILG